jgi:hypothetical protein
MSDLLNSASLVMIPSGYKEDVVYSQIPTDGSGDLSFTRASNGTRINSAGLVEVCPWNMLQYSEQIDNGVWTKFSPTSVTADTTTAPNGTTTADTISTSATAVIRQSVTLSANETYTYSIYVKKISYDFFGFQSLISGTGVKSVFDLSNGTVTSQGSGHTASIESVGNGWYRCIITFNVGSSASNIFDLAADGTSATLRTFYAWGAQLNIGSTAKPYFPTTDRLNVPRLTYQNGGGGCPSLLLEKQSTNLVTYSEQLDNADWTKLNTTVSANSTTSPDGTQNADTVTPTTTNGVHRIEQDKATASQVFTQSIFAKANGYNFIALENGGEVAYFNISTGVVGTVSAGTASIQNMGNGWYRCIFTATALNTKSYFYVANADNSVSFAGDSTSGIFVWGCQFEAGSYATSYISTTSASATRVADACFKTGISSLIGQSEGTVFADFNITGFESNYASAISINDGVPNNYVWLTIFANGNLRAEVWNGSVQASITYSGAVVGGRYKMAFGYKTNDFALYVNGTLVGTDTSGATFSGTTLSRIDNDLAGVAPNNVSQSTNQVALFKTRLTNAELASLTTI